jgi:hypothetical protein
MGAPIGGFQREINAAARRGGEVFLDNARNILTPLRVILNGSVGRQRY